jgi:probable F420-dependent oxidoreductase
LSFGGFPFSDPKGFWRWVDACEDSNVDSIFLPDRLVGPLVFIETLSALAAIAGRTRRLKVGTDVIVLPLRDPVLLAKQCATIDYLSDGRFLPMFGVGNDNAAEWDAMGISTRGRGARSNEMLELLGRLWTEDDVSFDGKHFRLRNVTVLPKPKQSPFPVWIGGASDAAVERTARYGHGWISGSTGTPDETARVIAAIKKRAAELGRVIDDDHYGGGFSFRFGDWDEPVVQRHVKSVAPRMGDREPSTYLAVGGPEAILQLVHAHRASGVSKFVLRPIASSDEEMVEQTLRLSRDVIPLVEKLD